MLANGLIKPLWLLAEHAVQNQVGHAAFGYYSSLYQLAYVLSWLLESGTNILLLQAMASTPPNLQAVAGMSSLRLLLGLIYLPAVAALAWALGYTTPTSQALVPILGLSLLLTQYGTLTRSALQGAQRFRADSWLAVAERGFLLLLLVPFFLYQGSILAYASLGLVSSLLCFVLHLHLLHQLGVPLWVWPSSDFVRQALRAGFPFLLFALLTSLHDRLAQIWIAHSQGNEAAGLYAAAFRWYTAAQMYVWVVIPVFTAAFARSTNNMQQTFSQGLAVLNLPIACAVLAFTAYSPYASYFIPSSTPAQVLQIGQHLQWLAWPLLLLVWGSLPGAWLAAQGRWRWLLAAGSAALLLNLATWALLGQQPWAAQAALALGYGGMLAMYIIGLYYSTGSMQANWQHLRYILIGPTALGLGLLLQYWAVPIVWGLPMGCCVLLVLGLPGTAWAYLKTGLRR